MKQTLRHFARSIRQVTFAGARTVGGFRWLGNSDWRRRHLLILCYHGVSLRDEHEWDPELFVSPAFLRRRFEILRDTGCTVLPLGEAVRALRSGTLPRRSVVLTFDDGFYNYLAAAVPLLEQFRYPATNYVSSYYSIHQRPILQLALRYLLWRARQQVLSPGHFPGQTNATDLGDHPQREMLASHLLVDVRKLSGNRDAQQAWLADVAARLGIDWSIVLQNRLFHLMTAAEIAEAARRGTDIQLHTHRHRTPRDESQFTSEVVENRSYLEAQTGQPAVHFCYPSGDVDSMFLPLLRGLNVETATTCEVDMARSTHDPLLLPRFVDTMGQSELAFESWLSGMGALLRKRSS